MLPQKEMFHIQYGPDEISHKKFNDEGVSDNTKRYITETKRLTPEIYKIAKEKYKNHLSRNPYLTADQFHEVSDTKYASNPRQINTLINDPKKRDFKYNNSALIDPGLDVAKQIKSLPEELKSKLAKLDSHVNHRSFSYKPNFYDLMKLKTQDEKDIYLKHMQIYTYGHNGASLILSTKFASDNSAHHIHDKLISSGISAQEKIPVIHELMYNPNISKENKKIIYNKESGSRNPIPNLDQYERFVK